MAHQAGHDNSGCHFADLRMAVHLRVPRYGGHPSRGLPTVARSEAVNVHRRSLEFTASYGGQPPPGTMSGGWYRYGVTTKGVPSRTSNSWASPRDPEVETQQDRQVVTPLAVGHRYGVAEDLLETYSADSNTVRLELELFFASALSFTNEGGSQERAEWDPRDRASTLATSNVAR